MVGKDKVVASPVNVGSHVARNLDDTPQAIDELSRPQVAAQAGQALGQRVPVNRDTSLLQVRRR